MDDYRDSFEEARESRFMDEDYDSRIVDAHPGHAHNHPLNVRYREQVRESDAKFREALLRDSKLQNVTVTDYGISFS